MDIVGCHMRCVLDTGQPVKVDDLNVPIMDMIFQYKLNLNCI